MKNTVAILAVPAIDGGYKFYPCAQSYIDAYPDHGVSIWLIPGTYDL